MRAFVDMVNISGRNLRRWRLRGVEYLPESTIFRTSDQLPHISLADMRPAIKDLLQLTDGRLFEEVAEGIRLIVEHAESLESTAVRLRAIDEHRAAAIVSALAKEESAKVLILLDLVRCPRSNQDGRSKTVKAFGNHLAKEIYADSCDWRPVDFAEVTRIVNRERRPYYLDGPNDVDWILPNYATARRENRMYVDYVQDMAVENGEYDWVSPLPDSLYREYGDVSPSCLVVARALHRVRMTTPEGLAAVADLWRGFEPQPQTTRQELRDRNYESLVRVSEARQNRKVHPEDARAVCHHWPFPLWPLDLRQSKGPTKAELRRQRAEQIKFRLKRASERNPPPSISRSKVVALSRAHADFRAEEEQLIASLPGSGNGGLRLIPAGFATKGKSYQRLRCMVCDLSLEELMDLAVLGWFGRQPESGWAHLHQHARSIISDASIDYVCGLGEHWITGLEQWEQPPQLPARLTIGGDTA